MADQPKGSEKTLEMRVAELEDKLSKIHITEEEIKAYQKVSSLMGGAAAAGPTPGPMPDPNNCIQQWVIRQPIVTQPIRWPIIRWPIIRQCWECFECQPCWPGGGNVGGGGFGTLGG